MQKENSDGQTEDEICEEKEIKCRASEKSLRETDVKKIDGERETGEPG